jgi:hypothetical protein
MRYVIEGTLTDIEESGQVVIGHTQFDDMQSLGEDDGKFFVRLHSYQDDGTEPLSHPLMEEIRGKRIRVTVETLDELGKVEE